MKLGSIVISLTMKLKFHILRKDRNRNGGGVAILEIANTF